MKPCVGNIKFQGIKADKGTVSSLYFWGRACGVSFREVLPQFSHPTVLCLLSTHWLLLFISFLILSPFCLHIPWACQLFLWNWFLSDPALLLSIRERNLAAHDNHISAIIPGSMTGLGCSSPGRETVLGLDANSSCTSRDQEGRRHLV